MRSYRYRGATTVRQSSPLLGLCAAAVAGLMLLAPGLARADSASPLYRSVRIVSSGDQNGKIQIPPKYDLFVGGLADSGDIVFSAGNNQGTLPEQLLKWSDGMLIPIVVPSTGPVSASAGDIYWAHDVTIDRPVSMNQRGNVVFSANHTGGYHPWGTFLWNEGKQKATPVLLQGMPATGDLLFTIAGGFAPAINNADEMALVASVKGPAGPTNGYGMFFLGQDGVLRSVLLPNQDLPGGSGHEKASTDAFLMPSINDAGVIAFVSRTRASSRYSAYLWEYGTIVPVLISGTEIPGSGKVTGISSAFVNNKNRSVLLTATTDRWGSRQGLYRVLNGRITTVAAPGGAMPGGGTLQTVQTYFAQENSLPFVSVSPANAAGEHAFLATLVDGSTAAYRIDASGNMSLIYTNSATPAPVHITETTLAPKFVPGSRPCLDNHGQVALSVRAEGGGSAILLLSPIK